MGPIVIPFDLGSLGRTAAVARASTLVLTFGGLLLLPVMAAQGVLGRGAVTLGCHLRIPYGARTLVCRALFRPGAERAYRPDAHAVIAAAAVAGVPLWRWRARRARCGRMRLNEVSYPGGTPIDGYGPGFVRAGGRVWEGAVLILPGAIGGWQRGDAAPILAAAGEIDVLLHGTGAEVAHADPAFRAALEGAGIGIEAMATPAACRTFNVLLGEGRRVAAALLPV